MAIDPQKIFRNYCKSRALRYTPERGIIIDEIYREDGHFDADQLFLRIRRRHPKTKISRASVYRTIPHLIQSGLARESFHEEGRTCYEHILGHSHHDHIKCLSCGKIIEFYDRRIDTIQQELCKKYRFQMAWHLHVLAGRCDSCHKKARKASKHGDG